MFSDFSSIVFWYLIGAGLAALFLPLVFSLFPHFWDRGWPFARIISTIALSYSIFVLSFFHILPFFRESLFIIILGFAAINLVYFHTHPGKWDDFVKTLKDNKLKFFSFELLFFVCLATWSFVRGFAPDIEGLEKFMDWGFINAILRTRWMPPTDMWFAGSPINYYYFGHLMFATLTRLSGLSSTITYNLSIATTFAFTFTLGFSLSSNLAHSLKAGKKYIVAAGLISALFLSLGGNLHPLYKLTQLRGETGSLKTAISRYWYPDATRFIGFDPETNDRTIHEFPLYSFVVADLHGHLNDVAPVLFFLSFLFSLSQLLAAKKILQAGNIKYAPILGLTLSVMYMTNAWDFAIYGLFFAFFLLFVNLSRLKPVLSLKLPKILLGELIIPGVFVLLLWFVFTLPFSLNFTPMAEGIRLSDAHSPFYQLFILHGGFWMISLSYLVFLVAAKTLNKKFQAKRADYFVLSAILLATLLIIIPEIAYLKDIYIYEHRRANTMFKLVYQSFIIYSVVSGYLIIRIQQKLKKTETLLFRLPINLFFLVIFVSQLIYPYFAIKSYYGSLREYQGLSGVNFLKRSYPDNYQAIFWLNKYVDGQPVILEAAGDSYTDFNQISMATGLPTVEGWLVHEWLWRGGWDEPGGRAEEVRQVYEAQSTEEARLILNKYQVRYIVLGLNEREKYPALREDIIASLGRVVFSQGTTTIYQIAVLGIVQ